MYWSFAWVLFEICSKHLFPFNKLIMYFVIAGLLLFFFHHPEQFIVVFLFYLGELPIWKCNVGILVCVESFQNIFGGLTWITYNLCGTVYLETSYSTSGVNYIGLSIIGYSFYLMAIEPK